MPGFSLGLVVVPRNHRKTNHAAILLLPLGNGLEILYDEFVVSSRVLPIHLLILVFYADKDWDNGDRWDIWDHFQITLPLPIKKKTFCLKPLPTGAPLGNV